jgi:hypothetical protein
VSAAEVFGFGSADGEVMQVAYTVDDVDTAIARYLVDLRVGPWFVRGPFTPAARYRGTPSRMSVTLARAFRGSMMIELVQQHDEEPSVYMETIGNRGHGFHHWAVATRDVDAALARYRDRGYELVYEDRLPSGAFVGYIDSSLTMPGMIEVIEMTSGQEQTLTAFWQAAQQWDGVSDPVREG